MEQNKLNKLAVAGALNTLVWRNNNHQIYREASVNSRFRELNGCANILDHVKAPTLRSRLVDREMMLKEGHRVAVIIYDCLSMPLLHSLRNSLLSHGKDV